MHALSKDEVALARESSMDRCCNWQDHSVACGNQDLETAAATKYRDPKSLIIFVRYIALSLISNISELKDTIAIMFTACLVT
jgi:hypothetical protein